MSVYEQKWIKPQQIKKTTNKTNIMKTITIAAIISITFILVTGFVTFKKIEKREQETSDSIFQQRCADIMLKYYKEHPLK